MNPWIEALRLRTLPMSLTGAIVASGMALATETFRLEVFPLLVATVLGMQILGNFADEYGDLQNGADNDDRIGPKRAMQRGEISFKQMRVALIGVGALTFALGVVLIVVAFGSDLMSIVIFLCLGAFALFSAIAYTVGKHAYGYYGLGDIFCIACYGLLAVCGGFYLYSHTITLASIAAGFGAGFLINGMLNLNNMRDRTTDAATGKRTLVVQMGADGGRRYHNQLVIAGMACLLCASIALASSVDQNGYALLWPFQSNAYNDTLTATADSLLGEESVAAIKDLPAPWQWWRLLYLFAFIPLVLHLRTVNNVLNPKDFDALLRPYSFIVTFACLFFSVCIAI
ncbi:MAG: 1,4-dihydroxy-2-naphthoate octaprenyltransferase [Coriobacteriales bacterium]|jgi:1,4-dihydroxy-2-naphthoate octaprenyltransferase|nr:1,4-dihydroxy-2-naphthoate octaprenyltransferase [Coriobacteriales bacterium]